jgi:hypothetical protein
MLFSKKHSCFGGFGAVLRSTGFVYVYFGRRLTSRMRLRTLERAAAFHGRFAFALSASSNAVR